MNRTVESLANIINYDNVRGINALVPGKIQKDQIPTFILCSNYEKAMSKLDQKLERYIAKLKSIEGDIALQKEIIQKANYNTSYVDRTSSSSVARYNDWIDRGRKAAEKHDELVDKYNDNLRELKEKREDLTQDALIAIDDDIVAVLDKCNKVAYKLSESQKSDDLVSATEICFLELKIYSAFDDLIDGNAARKDARDRIAEVNQLLPKLCADEQVRNHMNDLFRRNIYLVEKNAEQYGQITQMLGAVDQVAMDGMIQALQKIYGEKFNTTFQYEGVVDPAEIDKILSNINAVITALNDNISRTKKLAQSTKTLAEAGTKAHQGAETLLEAMKTAKEDMANDLIHEGPFHFVSEMLNESVIDEFYQRDLKPAISSFRDHLAGIIGEENLDTLLMAVDERYSIGKAEAAIQQANLLRLQAERDKVDKHIKDLSQKISAAQSHIKQVQQIPEQNAETFQSEVSTQYMLSCLPFIGFAFALGILQRIKKFEPAFKSTNEVYKNLGTFALVKNRVMMKVILILGGILGFGGAFVFFAAGIGSSVSIKTGVPAVILMLYLATSGLLLLAEKRLASLLGLSESFDLKSLLENPPSTQPKFDQPTSPQQQVIVNEEGEDIEENFHCLECGSLIPEGQLKCEKCGWSYEQPTIAESVS